ncbi:MAG: hypothetical protein GY859_41460 [Desulfobacterales bacterium]|nr:hypothetical protein [Desulfobacterales bacterium]
MKATYSEDLEFTYRAYKNGEVLIKRNGRLAAALRGAKARDFSEEIKAVSFADQQQYMARITGNYKRGNEKLARNHPRNRS